MYIVAMMLSPLEEMCIVANIYCCNDAFTVRAVMFAYSLEQRLRVLPALLSPPPPAHEQKPGQ